MKSIDDIELIGAKFIAIHCKAYEPTDDDGNVLVALCDWQQWNSLMYQIVKVGDECKVLAQSNVGDFIKLEQGNIPHVHPLGKGYINEYEEGIRAHIIDEKFFGVAGIGYTIEGEV